MIHDVNPAARQAGVMMPVFSLRRRGDLGIGDTLALRQWLDWAAEHHVGFIQLLPIHEHGAEESPYSAISSVALDPVYLAMELAEIPWLDAELLAAAKQEATQWGAAPSVDYRNVRRVKRRLLESAWQTMDRAPADLSADFEAFCRQESAWLEDYTTFRYLMELHGEALSWDRWPESCRTPESARAYIARLRQRDAAEVNDRLSFFAFVQWLCFRQWRALRQHADACGVQLMGDIPIGVSWHSCDVFFQREEFLDDWFGGSPPEGMSQSDPFFQQWGQNWGIPLYRWDHMEANGFRWWRERIQRVTEIFRMFRLDHILGFYRIYAFPWHPERNQEFIGVSPETAARMTGGPLPGWHLRPDDTVEHKAANRDDGDVRLRAVLDAAGDAEVIAEDLGWVPEYVRPHLTDLGIGGFRIPHWDCNEFGHPTPGNCFPEHSFAAYSTHDHDPLNGIWRGCLDAIRRHRESPGEHTGWQANGAHHTLRILSEFAGMPVPPDGNWLPYTQGVRLRLFKALLDSNSRHVCFMITELFSLDVRINQPGTTGAGNWTFRLPWTLEQVASDPTLLETCRTFAALIQLSGRKLRLA